MAVVIDQRLRAGPVRQSLDRADDDRVGREWQRGRRRAYDVDDGVRQHRQSVIARLPIALGEPFVMPLRIGECGGDVRVLEAKTVIAKRRRASTAAWIRLAVLRLTSSDGGLSETETIELTVAPRQLPSGAVVEMAQTVAAVRRIASRNESAPTTGSIAAPVPVRSTDINASSKPSRRDRA